MVKRIFKNSITFVIIMLFVMTSFASERIITGGIDSMIDDGPGADTELLVAGDSYAMHFYNDEKNRDLRLFPFFQEGQTIEENWEILFNAFTVFKRWIFLSISVNDRHRNTHPNEFGNQLRNLFAVAQMTGKKVFVHSYMYYDLGSAINFAYLTNEYDSVIRTVIQEFPNTVYFIDMSDCVGSEYILPDGIHYNKKFNDTLYDRIQKKIREIKGIN